MLQAQMPLTVQTLLNKPFKLLIPTLMTTRDECVQVILEQYGGDIDCFAGDAVLVVFQERAGSGKKTGNTLADAVRQALECARAVVRSLPGFRASPGDTPLQIHAGLSAGELHSVICSKYYTPLSRAGRYPSLVKTNTFPCRVSSLSGRGPGRESDSYCCPCCSTCVQGTRTPTTAADSLLLILPVHTAIPSESHPPLSQNTCLPYQASRNTQTSHSQSSQAASSASCHQLQVHDKCKLCMTVISSHQSRDFCLAASLRFPRRPAPQ